MADPGGEELVERPFRVGEQARPGLQILPGHQPASKLMVRRDDQPEAGGPELFGRIGVGRSRRTFDGQRGIELRPRDPYAQLAAQPDGDPHIDLRPYPPEGTERAGEQERADRLHRAEPDHRRSLLGGGGQSGFRQCDQRPRAREQGFGRSGEHRLAAGAAQGDLGAEQAFQRQQRLGPRRLRATERPRGGADAHRDQRAAVPHLEILRHGHPIGNPDASIAVLAARVAPVKQARTSGKRRVKNLLNNAALLVIDMQVGFDDPAWGPRNNPGAEANVASLIAAWRAANAPVIHIHHDSPDPLGRLRRGAPGNAPKPEALPRADERIYRKTVNSAFIGTNLEADLRARHVETLAIVGLTTNHCISTTARMAGNLGFETMVAADATATFDRANLDGTMRRAEDVHQAALSALRDEFAQIVTTAWLLAALGGFAGERATGSAERRVASHA